MVDRKRWQRVREGKQITEGLQKGLEWAATVRSNSPRETKKAAERAGRNAGAAGRHIREDSEGI